MAQPLPDKFIMSMNRVSKVVPPKRTILKDISLSFFPGAKIGVLGLNGSGKSTLLRIMAGVDTEFEGEAKALAGTNIGYLSHNLMRAKPYEKWLKKPFLKLKMQ